MEKFRTELIATANAVATRGKGILAADESTGTIGKRFAPINVENNEENRRAYRQLLVTCAGLNEFISGIIFFEETLYQKADDGRQFVDICREAGIVPGIKVDKGVAPLTGGLPGETTTQGNDGLGDRCAKYYAQGARFAKWRAVLKVDTKAGAPSELSCLENGNGLARYAEICQANGLVPIVEPEVLMDGDHSFEQAAEATERAIVHTFFYLARHRVLLEGILLKPNMVRQGTDNAAPYQLVDIATYTLRTMQRSVPAAVPGIMFLSGGMSEEEATVALHALNKDPAARRPWSMSFSYGRALQHTVLRTWLGKSENVAEAQKMLLLRARANSTAQLGKYDGFAATADSEASLTVRNYVY